MASSKGFYFSNLLILIIFIICTNKNFSQLAQNEKLFYAEILKKHEGNVIIVDFWASWCAPCLKDLKKINKLYKTFENKNLIVLYFSLDNDLEKMNNAINKDKLIDATFNYMLKEIKQDEKSNEIGKINIIPRYLLYDKKGLLITNHFKIDDKSIEIINNLLISN